MQAAYLGWSKMIALPALVTAITLMASAQGQETDKQRTIRGTVRSFTTAPKGETHGLILDNDTEVRFPPHLGDKVKAVVGKGDRVRVTGRAKTGPKGDTNFHATSITNLDTSKSFEILDDAPPIGPKDKGPKGKKGKDKKGKDKGPKEKDFDEERKGPEGKELLRAPKQEADDLATRIRTLEAELRRLRKEQDGSRQQD